MTEARPDGTRGIDRAMAAAVLTVSPFTRWLGAELRHFERGAVDVAIVRRPEHAQHHGFVHGGVVSALADIAAVFAGASVLGDVLTAEFKISFVRPAVGAVLVARGRVEHAGRTQAITEARVYVTDGAEERLVAIALATIVRARGDTGGDACGKAGDAAADTPARSDARVHGAASGSA